MRTRSRALALAACALAGTLVGGIGWWVTGAQAWWLAIVAAIAAGWWFVADPTQCTPGGRTDAPGER